jgi:methyl-accepting chemotaxis protein
LTLVPVAITSGLIGRGSYNAAERALLKDAEDQMTSLRENKKQQVEEYYNALSREVKGLAASPLATNALRELGPAFRSVASDVVGKAKDPKKAEALVRASTEGYYTNDFLKKFAEKTADKPPVVSDLISKLDFSGLTLQHLYIAANPNPLGEKLKLDRAADASSYSAAHVKYHPGIRLWLENLGFYDVFLVDGATGNVVYTTFKELDFATNLKTGPYAGTKLAEAYNKVANASGPGDYYVTDFAPYAPSYNDQAQFASAPLYADGKQIGVLVVQVPIASLVSIMTSKKQWKQIGLGESGESYLVGPDYLARTDSRFLLEDPAGFLKALQGKVAPDLIANIKLKNTNIGLQKIETQGTKAVFEKKESGFAQYPDYRGVPVFGSYAPLKTGGLTWGLIAERDVDEVLAPTKALATQTWYTALGVVAAVLAIAAAAVTWFLRRFMQPINQLQSTVSTMSGGDLTVRSKLSSQDEIQDLGDALDNLLDDRVAAQQKAEAENEGLNKSVIELLQAVFQLSQKDLTVKAPVTQDVVGTVSDAINLLASETGTVLQQVTHVAGTVERASNNVRAKAVEFSKTAEREREEVQRMTANIGSAVQLLQHVATLAENSNQAAAQATATTQTAMETVNGTVLGMSAIRETIAETEKRIKRLGERSQEISGIVNLINSITERTQVLALNASMEAAAAGDVGRGFAVIAEEVQGLAESARSATAQISSLVTNIQQETKETIGTVNRTIAQVVEGSGQAEQAGRQMLVTQEASAKLVNMVQQIAEAAQAQVQIANELSARVKQIGENVIHTASQVEEQNVETQSLVDAARSLVESVRVFKLPDSMSVSQQRMAA